MFWRKGRKKKKEKEKEGERRGRERVFFPIQDSSRYTLHSLVLVVRSEEISTTIIPYLDGKAHRICFDSLPFSRFSSIPPPDCEKP